MKIEKLSNVELESLIISATKEMHTRLASQIQAEDINTPIWHVLKSAINKMDNIHTQYSWRLSKILRAARSK